MGLKPIILSEQNWDKLKYQLSQNYPKSVMLTRWKMREVLGFTDRLHTEYVDTRSMAGEFGMYPEYGSGRQPKRVVCLDFYDEAKKTMFLLKYSDWIKQ
jgi:hypothetical protein